MDRTISPLPHQPWGIEVGVCHVARLSDQRGKLRNRWREGPQGFRLMSRHLRCDLSASAKRHAAEHGRQKGSVKRITTPRGVPDPRGRVSRLMPRIPWVGCKPASAITAGHANDFSREVLS